MCVYTDGIVSTMSKQAGPSAVEVTSADQLKAKLEKYNDHCIVGECVEEVVFASGKKE